MLRTVSNVFGLVRGGYWLTKVYFRYSVFRMASTHSIPSSENHSTFSVTTLPALEDNFMYLITDHATNQVAVVDPVDPDRVKVEVDKIPDAKLTTVLTTHHHWDHAGGNNKLLGIYPDVTVIGGDDRVDGLTRKVTEGDVLKVGHTNVQCLFTPCHTKGHICYLVTESSGESPAVFTGDTLFLAGCGKFFEGSAEQMYDNLFNKLGKLPDETKVYCGHEYSLQNLKFAKSVDPSNKSLEQKIAFAQKRRDEKLPVPPSTIGEEKAYNPFMRVKDAKEMGDMRERKNNFR